MAHCAFHMGPMTPDDETPSAVSQTDEAVPLVVNGKALSAVQRQALREAQARRLQRGASPEAKEIGGADRTTDPTRYGDWEKNGRAVDFS
jgi:hypothetical protein